MPKNVGIKSKPAIGFGAVVAAILVLPAVARTKFNKPLDAGARRKHV